MESLNLLIKPASSMCNMRCGYCFYRDISAKREQSSYGFMNESTLEQVMKHALQFADKECTIAYQGGEPTLIGLDFFKKSIEFQNKYNEKQIIIHNAIQTNGYCLDEEWAKFMAENHFLVGLSIDGTKDTHNAFRHDMRGCDTFNRIMKTTQLFNKHKVEYNILTVVNARTAKHIISIYNFYKKNHFLYLQFIPCLEPLGKESGGQTYSLTPKMYGEFLKNLFDLWYDDFTCGQEIHIDQFENYVGLLMGQVPSSCGMTGVCSLQNVIEADGEVYPCDFYVLDKYKLGNLNCCDFSDIYQKREEIKFIQESTSMDAKCQNCKFKMICRGGCRRYREPSQNGAYSLNHFCESYYMFFEYAIARLQDMAQYYLRR